MDKETLQEWIGGFAFLQEIIGRKEYELEIADFPDLDGKEYEVCEAVHDALGTAREALSRASRKIDAYLKENKWPLKKTKPKVSMKPVMKQVPRPLKNLLTPAVTKPDTTTLSSEK